ncbi:MAG: DUF190 domain-containing protein [Mariprofundales bacterium]|nr:DUF190 domain-containing protein [Mariprofundales bacterium]
MREAGTFLRIYFSESDQIDGKPATEAIIDLCREAGLHAVSVMRCIEGMGRHGVHTTSFLSMSNHLPLLVEIVDTPERIEQAIIKIRPHLNGQLAVTWPTQILHT